MIRAYCLLTISFYSALAAFNGDQRLAIGAGLAAVAHAMLYRAELDNTDN